MMSSAWRSRLRFASRKCATAVTAVVVALAVVFSVAAGAYTQGLTPCVSVEITVDGQTWEYGSSKPTVGEILKEAGVQLGPKDRVVPGIKTQVKQGLKIRVFRIEEKIISQNEPIPYRTITKFNPYSRGGRVVLRPGARGEKKVKYLVTYKDGVKVGSKVLGAVLVKEPRDEVVSLSRGALLSSRGLSISRTIRMHATGYAPFRCGGSRSGRTACGLKAGNGVVAVDPRVIPLGTKLYVEGYGYCVAGDVGGAIKGNRIDLGFDSYREAVRFGRRYVTVHILK